MKAYTAVTAKLAANENRGRAEREEMLREVTEYKRQATPVLMRRKLERVRAVLLWLDHGSAVSCALSSSDALI